MPSAYPAARLDVIPSPRPGEAEALVATLKNWLIRFHIEPLHLRGSDGEHHLVWTLPAGLWPRPGLLEEYVAHQVLPLCPWPAELTAGLTGNPAIGVQLHLPWPEQKGQGVNPNETAQNVEALWAEYQQSRLAQFHQHYYAEKPHPPNQWKDTYDRIEPALLPACVAVLFQANNLHLRGWTGLHHLVRSLLGLGWHPRHIAGIVCSRWTRDYPDLFLEPLVQADHLVRCCTGAILRQLDRLDTFDCDSVRAAGICPPNPCCPVDLATLKKHLNDDAY